MLPYTGAWDLGVVPLPGLGFPIGRQAPWSYAASAPDIGWAKIH